MPLPMLPPTRAPTGAAILAEVTARVSTSELPAVDATLVLTGAR